MPQVAHWRSAVALPLAVTYWPALQVDQVAQEPWLVCAVKLPEEQAEQPWLEEVVPEVETYWPAVQVVQLLQEPWLA